MLGMEPSGYEQKKLIRSSLIILPRSPLFTFILTDMLYEEVFPFCAQVQLIQKSSAKLHDFSQYILFDSWSFKIKIYSAEFLYKGTLFPGDSLIKVSLYNWEVVYTLSIKVIYICTEYTLDKLTLCPHSICLSHCLAWHIKKWRQQTLDMHDVEGINI